MDSTIGHSKGLDYIKASFVHFEPASSSLSPQLELSSRQALQVNIASLISAVLLLHDDGLAMSKASNSQLQVPQIVVTNTDDRLSSSGHRRARSSSPTPAEHSGDHISASASSASLVHPADILTFRYMGDAKRKGKQVWVDAPATYNAAIDRVVTEFRHELGSVDRRDIALLVGAKIAAADSVDDPHGLVRIGQSDEAWARVISTLVRYEIIEIHVDGPAASADPPAYTADSQKPAAEWMPATKPLLAGKDRKSRRHFHRIASWLTS